jgi:heme-degrading monooxygenase HmoA
MPRLVVTRLRLRDPQFFDDFVAAAVAIVDQAKSSEGNLAAEVLAEAHNTYWTGTAWRDENAMRSFMRHEPHLSTMGRIDEWCDEATFVNWDQGDAQLPTWEAAYARLCRDGHVVQLPHETAENRTRAFPAPEAGG